MTLNEEQELEIEALQSIFEEGKEFIRKADNDFILKLLPHPMGEKENHVGVTLHIIYTEAYPEEAPEWELTDVKGLSDDNLEKLKGQIEEAVSNNLGMAMVYTMAEACQEFLKENNFKPLSMHEEMMLRMEGKTQQVEGADDDEEDEEDGEDEEDEDVFEEEEWKGLKEKEVVPEKDRITPESFKAWKVKFEEEMFAAGILKKEEEKGQSGKQIFLQAQDAAAAENANGNAQAAGGQGGDVMVYDAKLFGEEDLDDLEDLSGGDD